jgi:hypothetical protein
MDYKKLMTSAKYQSQDCVAKFDKCGNLAFIMVGVCL